jgi:small conductance mechanosensitive channel
MPTEPLQEAFPDLNYFIVQFLNFLPRLIAALVIFVITLYVASLTAKIVMRALTIKKSNHRADGLIVKIVRGSILTLGTLLSLQQVGFNVSAFLAGLGILGFTIGFALQDVSKNFVSGILLYLQQPFDAGDSIDVAGFSGKVEEIDIRATKIRTFDGKLVLIPNADVFSKPITNFSTYPTRRVDLVVNLPNNTDLEKARQAVLDVAGSIPGVLADPAPQVIFNNFGAAAIGFTLYFWIRLDQLTLFAAQDAAVTGIKTALENLNAGGVVSIKAG